MKFQGVTICCIALLSMCYLIYLVECVFFLYMLGFVDICFVFFLTYVYYRKIYLFVRALFHLYFFKLQFRIHKSISETIKLLIENNPQKKRRLSRQTNIR
jgi:hypothetical protein